MILAGHVPYEGLSFVSAQAVVAFSASVFAGIRSRMDFFEHRYYRMVKILLMISGTWPRQPAFYSWGVIGLITIVYVSNTFPIVMGALKNREDIVILLQSAILLDLFAILCVKAICFKWNFKKIFKLLNRIRTDWQVWIDDEDVNILHDYAEQGRKLTLAWVVFFLSLVVIFMIQPIVLKVIDILMRNGSTPGKFPFPIDYYYFDEQEYYFCIITHEAASLTMAFLFVMSFDCMFIISVQHGCGIFAALGHKLSRIGENKPSAKPRNSANLPDNDNMHLEHLVWCLRRHHDAIEYAELIESTYSWSFFFTVGLNMLGISVAGYQVTKNTGNHEESLKFIISITTGFGHVYFESYMAQILMDHSISIRYSIQNSKWYKVSPKLQRFLYLMMIRSDVSCQLTAGKMSVMSIEYFATIVKTSMSCLTVLRSM